MAKGYHYFLDLIVGFSGLFAAFSIVWILAALFVALILGALVASVFGSIFYGMSRLARKMTPADED
jgi:hypothetical protein